MDILFILAEYQKKMFKYLIKPENKACSWSPNPVRMF